MCCNNRVFHSVHAGFEKEAGNIEDVEMLLIWL